jgi:hypothetical protein
VRHATPLAPIPPILHMLPALHRRREKNPWLCCFTEYSLSKVLQVILQSWMFRFNPLFHSTIFLFSNNQNGHDKTRWELRHP